MQKDFSFNRRDTSRFGTSSPRGGRGSGRSFGNRSDRPMMFDAVCAKCGKNCQVPFKPTGNRDVFCSNCFERDDGRNDRDSNRNYNSNRDSRFGEKEMFSATCDKCGNRCEVPFKPTSGKPVYCSDCFTKSDGRDGNDRNDRYEKNSRADYNYKSDNKSGGLNNDDFKKQFETLNKKIDEIQKLLNSMKAPEIKGLSAVEKFFEKEMLETPIVELKNEVKATVNEDVKKAIKKAKVKKTVKKAVKKSVKKAVKKA